MDISIPKIWQRVGMRSWHEEAKAEGLVTPPGPGPFLLVLHWPASASYLAVTARQGKDQFCPSPDDVVKMLEEHRIPKDRIPAALLKRRCNCLARVVSPGDMITLEFLINTNDPHFLEEAGTGEAGGTTREIEVLAVAAGEGGSPRIQVGALHVHLEPAAPMVKYDGYVALDLGNTNSTLVCLHAENEGHAWDVDLINVEQTLDPSPIPSAVRLTEFEPAPDDDPDHMETAVCKVGNAALDGVGGWLVLGAKRILAEADPNVRHDLWLGGQRYSVGKTLPAEVFLSEMFRAFHREKFEVPRQLAITHPTTFSPWEIEQLRQAVVQGWRRSLGATAKSYDPKRLTNPDLPHLLIDEASAAAFYFLYRDFLDVPGGLDLMHYLYPEGLNLLVYDCGGGTTDIALVHIQVHRGDASKGHRTSRMTIEVLGRTGHRSFGGDDITVAAFRVLKARVAAQLLGNTKVPYPEMPNEAGRLPTFLSERRKDMNTAVPTEFSRDNLSLGDNRRRMATTELLWKWAERFKIELGKESPAKVKHAEAMKGLIENLEAHHREAGTSNLDKERITRAIQGGIEIHREEIDALIREPLEQSIQYANRMIAAKLGKPDSPGGEVHRVYVVGNASRYPLIGTLIEQQLDVRFVTQRLGKVRGEDLKNSVAKGAALALQLMTRAQNIEIDFDRRLNRKLPFDVTFWNPTAGGHRSLFKEHQDYEQLIEKPLPVPKSRETEDEKRREVVLSRRWPGDEAPKQYLRFKFSEIIRGPLVVWFDTAKFKFAMRDDGVSGPDVFGEEIEKAAYVAPMQSGKL
jgi:hypothetical protein